MPPFFEADKPAWIDGVRGDRLPGGHPLCCGAGLLPERAGGHPSGHCHLLGLPGAAAATALLAELYLAAFMPGHHAPQAPRNQAKKSSATSLGGSFWAIYAQKTLRFPINAAKLD